MSEKQDLKQLDFANRCQQLDTYLNAVRANEPSDRIWASVLSGMLVDIAARQRNPKVALKEMILSMQSYLMKVQDDNADR